MLVGNKGSHTKTERGRKFWENAEQLWGNILMYSILAVIK